MSWVVSVSRPRLYTTFFFEKNGWLCKGIDYKNVTHKYSVYLIRKERTKRTFLSVENPLMILRSLGSHWCLLSSVHWPVYRSSQSFIFIIVVVWTTVERLTSFQCDLSTGPYRVGEGPEVQGRGTSEIKVFVRLTRQESMTLSQTHWEICLHMSWNIKSFGNRNDFMFPIYR